MSPQVVELTIGGRTFRVTTAVECIASSLSAAWEPALRSENRGARVDIRVEENEDIYLNDVLYLEHMDVRETPGRVEHIFFDTLFSIYSSWSALHAGCVLYGDKLVFLVGRSGSGKSSLTRELVKRGAGYLNDDLVLVGPARVLGVSRTIQFDALPLDAPVPEYLLDCDVESYQTHRGTEKDVKFPLWRAQFPVESELTIPPSNRIFVIDIARGEENRITPTSALERLSLLHSAALSSAAEYSGQLGFGPTYKCQWSEPAVAAGQLIELLEAASGPQTL